jgi:hypothetical protein
VRSLVGVAGCSGVTTVAAPVTAMFSSFCPFLATLFMPFSRSTGLHRVCTVAILAESGLADAEHEN